MGVFKKEKYFQSIRDMKINKWLRLHGRSIVFIKKIWPLFGNLEVGVCNNSHNKGIPVLPDSQYISSFALFEKRKNRGH